MRALVEGVKTAVYPCHSQIVLGKIHASAGLLKKNIYISIKGDGTSVLNLCRRAM